MLFGGVADGFTALFNDTWAYDYNANRWEELQPANPPAPRVYHFMGFEPATNRVVMFGGVLDESDWPHEPTINETWVYDVAANAWSQVFPKRPPSPRAWHVVSGTNGPVVLFGGGDSRWTYTNDTFLYTSRANRWKLVSPKGPHHGDDDDD
jgi:N-acetylneuraminic acid mutarotase